MLNPYWALFKPVRVIVGGRETEDERGIGVGERGGWSFLSLAPDFSGVGGGEDGRQPLQRLLRPQSSVAALREWAKPLETVTGHQRRLCTPLK